MSTSARKTAKTAEFRVDEGIDLYDCLYIIFLIGHFASARFLCFLYGLLSDKKLPRNFKLAVVKLGVEAALPKQCVVGAALYNVAVTHDQY